MDEWFLSRRDGTIVARHEVPGERCSEVPSRRDGRSHYQFHRIFVVKTEPRSVQSSRWDGAIFLVFQALRAWLLSACPSGTKTKRLALS